MVVQCPPPQDLANVPRVATAFRSRVDRRRHEAGPWRHAAATARSAASLSWHGPGEAARWGLLETRFATCLLRPPLTCSSASRQSTWQWHSPRLVGMEGLLTKSRYFVVLTLFRVNPYNYIRFGHSQDLYMFNQIYMVKTLNIQYDMRTIWN
jgi:hypothetical protein